MAGYQLVTETLTIKTGVTLTLSNEEADALISVLAEVDGDPGSRNQHVASVEDALEAAGYAPSNADIEGDIYFEEVSG